MPDVNPENCIIVLPDLMDKCKNFLTFILHLMDHNCVLYFRECEGVHPKDSRGFYDRHANVLSTTRPEGLRLYPGIATEEEAASQDVLYG